MSQIGDAFGDKKKLFMIVARFLHTDNDSQLPPCDSFNIQSSFQTFFSEQTSKIWSELIENVNNM